MLILPLSACNNCDNIECPVPDYNFIEMEFDLVDVAPKPRPIQVGSPPDDSSAGIWLTPEMGSSFTFTFNAAAVESGRAELRVFHASPPEAAGMPSDFFRLNFLARDSTGQTQSNTLYFEGGTEVLSLRESECCGTRIDAEMYVTAFNHDFNQRLSDDLQFISGATYELTDWPFTGGIVFGQ
ncbi:MAG: hypothetical protein ACOCZ8_03065 [Bacteroidota bacterium]